MDLPYQSLHCHTIDSDGLLTHEQVLSACQTNKIGVVAFTDHDIVLEAKTIEKLKNLLHPVKFVSGIEVSCNTIAEVEGNISGLHVVGLFVDPTNPDLVAFSQKQIEGRHARMKKWVKNLTDLGFVISEEDVLKNTPGRAIVQPHIVTALASHPENLKLLEKFYQELLELAKTDKLRQKQLEEIQIRGGDRKWYALVMSDDSVHPTYVSYENKESLDGAAKLIRAAGGLAILAHWSYNRDKVPLTLIDKLLGEKRLDGLETVYAFGGEANQSQFDKDMADLTALCEKYDLVQGGGGDFHRPEEFGYILDPRFANCAQKTKGMVERILALHPNLDLTSSSLSR